MKSTPQLLVIGSPSIDTLHFKGRTERSAGGAGLYTALAANRTGTKVSLFGVKPEELPEVLLPLQERLVEWLGPEVPLEDLPHFTISHQGDRADYLLFDAGAEADLTPSQLPEHLSKFDGVHINALGTVKTQIRFAEACRQRGAKMLSSGGFLTMIEEGRDEIRKLIDITDIFFVNEEEALGIFGSIEEASTDPGKLLFITRGKSGAIVVQGAFKTKLPAIPAEVLDPTGAGDTFCGAVFAHLLRGEHPVMAAQKAMALASEEIKHVGPTALLFDRRPPEVPLDSRVSINERQIHQISDLIKEIPEAEAFNFVSDYYPPVDHPAALDYFFAQILQQFSFWETENSRYARPLIAMIDGHESKGSTYLSRAYMRALEGDPDFFSPKRQASLSRPELLSLYRADNGSMPMPAFDLHLKKSQDYGRDMRALDLTPMRIVERANLSPTPLRTLLSLLDHIGGYKEDPLRKKASLLALILMERPEHFLKIAKGEEIKPVVDYHCMRYCLRTGMVDILDLELKEKIANRIQVTVDEEGAIRYACYLVVQKLVENTGLSSGAVDNITFGYTRKHCPEMIVPICEHCEMNPACKHRIELFQPVLRTTFY